MVSISDSTNKTSKTRTLQIFVVGLSLFFLFFPLIHDVLPVFKELAPYGVAQVENRLKFSKKAFMKSKFQKKADELAKKQSGFWKPFTELGNEKLLHLFNQITAFHNNSVFMGQDDQLVQTIHLSAFNRAYDKSLFENKTKERLTIIKLLQDYQASRGKSLITLISPNVMEVYPETVPDRYISSTRLQSQSSYEQMKVMLDQHGINYIDGPKILIDAKKDYPFRMFGRTASHWNDVASCLVLLELNKTLQSKKTASFPSFSCTPWNYQMPPRGKDLDLLNIANLLFPSLQYEPLPYVEVLDADIQARNKLKLPEVTMSGTSYLFAFADAMKRHNLSSNFVHYFYYRQRRSKDMKGFGPLRKKEMDWQEILNRDITIIDAQMRQPTSIGYGFVEDAMRFINNK